MSTTTKPIPTAVQLLSARRRGVCRLCGAPIYLLVDPEYPSEYDRPACRIVRCSSGALVFLDFGEEFCHCDCAVDRSQEVVA